jgi:AraC-like DNA-binding protein
VVKLIKLEFTESVMFSIDLNSPIEYMYASLRYFAKNERHINRVCHEYVLLMVFDGTLRFNEDGVEYEVGAGEYFIQRIHTKQSGTRTSDAPKYLYVHFFATEGNGLYRRGTFDYTKLKSKMERLDAAEKSGGTLIEKCGIFYGILSSLVKRGKEESVADKIAALIEESYKTEISLDIIARHFSFTKNHIINVFKKEYGITPFEYLNRVRIAEAKTLLEVTSRSLDDISSDCGFTSYSNFYKRFLAEAGCSPAAYRHAIRLSPTQPETVKNK